MDVICIGPECTNKVHGKGLCGSHLKQLSRGKSLRKLRDFHWNRGKCSFPRCRKKARINGRCSGHYIQVWKGASLRPLRNRVISQKCTWRDNKIAPEYSTARNHLRHIFLDIDKRYRNYRKMKTFLLWNPRKTGLTIGECARRAAIWMLEHGMAKPGKEWELHVLKTKKHPYGFFGPGGIMWRSRIDRHDQDLLDLIAEWPSGKFNRFVQSEITRRLCKEAA